MAQSAWQNRVGRLKSVKLTVTLTADVTALERTIARLDEHLANPELFVQLMRQAVGETLLTAYRQRFLDHWEALLSPHLSVKGKSSLAPTVAGQQAKEAVVRAYQALAHATTDGQRAAARKRLQKAEAKLVSVSEKPQGPSELSTGHYRERALEVLRMLTDESLVGSGTGDDQVHVGIGRLSDLESIETPSATPLVAQHETMSSFTTLWKQLEFGTGVYSSMPGARKQGWWYGPRPGYGIHLLGAQGAHAVFDAATGLPYTADALRFEEVFAGLLGKALSGA